MDIAQKIVTRLPLEELWNEKGPIAAARGKPLTKEDLTDLLRSRPVQFIVANAGAPLRWIPIGDRFNFWKSDARPHLAEPGSRAVLESFPDSYCYFASEWKIGESRHTLVVLEKGH